MANSWHSENPNMIFLLNHRLIILKVNENFNSWENEGLCLRVSAQGHWRKFQQKGQECPEGDGNHASPPYQKKKKTKPLWNLHCTWTAHTFQNENQGCEDRDLAGHNQEKAFPNPYQLPRGRWGSVWRQYNSAFKDLTKKNVQQSGPSRGKKNVMRTSALREFWKVAATHRGGWN